MLRVQLSSHIALAVAELLDPDQKIEETFLFTAGYIKLARRRSRRPSCRNRRCYGKQGVLYPRTGRLDTLGGGHHNIAWQISRDRRFVPNLGDIEKLVQEINSFNGNVVLSSEDFESVLHNRQMIGDFVRQLEPCAAEIVFVVNLRNQLSYCQSIFIENLGQHVGEEYARYVTDIISNGHFRIKEWGFQFDYAAMIESLSSLPIRLIVRNFHVLVKQSSIADFLEVIGLEDESFKDRIGYRANERPPLVDSIRGFCVNRFNRPLGDREILAVRLISGMIGNQKLINSNSTKTSFRNVFLEGNTEVCRRFGLPPGGLDLQIDTENGVSYERLFSFELQGLVLTMRNLLRAGQRADAERLAKAFVTSATS